MVVQYVSDGRANPNLQGTIGAFAFLLSLRVDLRGDDSFVDLLSRVTEEYCNAHEHADYAYVEAQVPRPEFVRNTGFNWIPQVHDSLVPQGSELKQSERAIRCCPISFEQPILKLLEWDREPFLVLFDTGNEIVGGVDFPVNRFSIETMERFTSNLLLFIRAMVRQSNERVKDVLLL
jgi:hypothetical protein